MIFSLLFAALMASPAPAQVRGPQDEPPKRVRSILLYGDEQCPKTEDPDEIVVCAEHEDPAKQYVPSDADSGDPDDGVPRAPDVTGLPSGGMRIGKTPRHPLIIDLKSIPEAPPGSDADKIARGEKAAP